MSRFFFTSDGTSIDLDFVFGITRHFGYVDDGVNAKRKYITVHFKNKEEWEIWGKEQDELERALKDYSGEIHPELEVPFECGTCGKEGRQKASNKTCPGCGSPLGENDEQ